jgi:hypothetical protein
MIIKCAFVGHKKLQNLIVTVTPKQVDSVIFSNNLITFLFLCHIFESSNYIFVLASWWTHAYTQMQQGISIQCHQTVTIIIATLIKQRRIMQQSAGLYIVVWTVY